jgi:hypothetical protein
VSEFDDCSAAVNHPLVHEPGVFFGLFEDEYHHALALSSSGIKFLRASTLDFWARSPLSPDPDNADKETEALVVGHA